MGCATPLGVGVSAVWKALLEGRSAVDRISIFEASTFPTKIGAEVRALDVAAERRKRPELSEAGRNVIFAMVAADQAFADSGLKPGGYDPERTGVYLGSGEGEQDFFRFVSTVYDAWNGDGVDRPTFLRLGTERLNNLRELEQEPNMPAGHIASRYNAWGPNCNCLTACAASSQALGEATEIVRRGDADVMFSGGCHSMLHPFGLAGFCLLTALGRDNDNPKGASRPFDRRRDGFILGEGSGMLVLEELEHARRRGARIYAELVGYGSTADAFRLTDSHDEGRGAIACMSGALTDAGIDPGDVDYINAHGTSTKVNDRIETFAIKQVFGEHASKIPISSTKSSMGHLIAAAGAVELIISINTILHGIVPPTINLLEPDPECDLDYVPNKPREHHVDVAMSNSFGFGGQNISLVVSRCDG
jgi:3-oxoacyl-[acyl-carrier-protein] synthase II